MKNKGFTLGEMLVTLGIIGVISMVALPAINSAMPNDGHLKFRKAYHLTSNLVSELVNDVILYPEPDSGEAKEFYLGNTAEVTEKGEKYEGETKFCELFVSRLNTVGLPSCESKNGFVDGNEPDAQFVTSDGINWILPISEFQESDDDYNYPIYVDINGAKGPNCFHQYLSKGACGRKPDRFTIYVRRNGSLVVTGGIEKDYLMNAYIQDYRKYR